MSVYRENAKPLEPPPKKKPLLCRIGLHFWGGWALDGCGVFWCTRCDKYFVTRAQTQPLKRPTIILSKREITVPGARCEGWGLGPPCTRRAELVVTVWPERTDHRLCEGCADRASWDEGPDVTARPIKGYAHEAP